MDQKMLVVVSILSARNFPRRPDCSLLIEAHLNGEVLTSDPVAHSSGVVGINTELAWEMTRKTFQQHKLHRTPIKLLVFALDNNTNIRQKVGYVMLDLRSAHPSSKEPSWFGVLNSTYSRLKPQLQVSLSLEEESAPPTSQESREDIQHSTIPVSLDLDPSGDFYTLGAASCDHVMYTLSLTLHNAHHLPLSPSNKLYFYYNLLGNDITSELFTPPMFSPECASIRIKSSRELLALLFAAQKDVEVHLCSGTQSVCKGVLSLTSLASTDLLSCSVPLGNEGCTVDVTVKLEETDITTPLLTPSSHAPLPSQAPPSSQSAHPPLPSQDAPPTTPTHDTPTPQRSAKRNLTQSFEDASLPTPAHSTRSTSSAGSTPSLHHPPATSLDAPPTTGSVPPPHIPVTAPHAPISTADSSKTTTETIPTVKTDVNTNISTVTMATGVHAQTTVASVQPASSSIANADGVCLSEVRSQNGSQLECPHRLKFSVDLRSLHNLKMDPHNKCYLRYSYPFFGNPYPVLIQPPVVPVRDKDQLFSHSFCSFDFATQISRLKEHLTHQPLVVEVWQSHDQSHDQIAGLAWVPLGSVLSHEQSQLEGGGGTRQVSSLRVPITPPPPSQPHTLTPPPPSQSHLLTLGYLNAVLILEDFGMVASENHVEAGIGEPSVPSRPGGAGVSGGAGVPSGAGGAGVPSGAGGAGGAGVPSGGQSLVGPLEYNTAVELELWKLAQQEAFQEQLKTRETAHMTKLGEELQRRETQRQAMLKQKLDHYSSLERQLQDGLQQLASQQRVLGEREAKVNQESERLARERQLLQDEVQRSQSQFRSQCEQQVEIERMKCAELQAMVNSLKRQVRDLEVKVQSREAEFESYRQQIVARPESKLHAELSILQLEKAELERKLSVLAKSKQHYKEQWTRALSELASCRQREQAAARERLLTQQRELEAMRMQCIETEHQKCLRQQLNQVKNEVEKLQEKTLSKVHPPPPSSPHASPSTQSRPPPLTSQDPASDPKTQPNPDVARWIEERDILLQTGVYSNTDTTIQKLDAKIRQALQQQTAAQ